VRSTTLKSRHVQLGVVGEHADHRAATLAPAVSSAQPVQRPADQTLDAINYDG
jgi:hypothetical protein